VHCFCFAAMVEMETVGVDWAALNALVKEAVLKLRYGKEDSAALRESAATENASGFRHDFEHLQGLVVVQKPEEISTLAVEHESDGKRFSLGAVFTKLRRNDNHSQNLPDVRYLVLDGQALHVYPVIVPATLTSDTTSNSKAVLSGSPVNPATKLFNTLHLGSEPCDSEMKMVIDKKRKVSRLSMVGAIVSRNEEDNSITINFGDGVASFTFEPKPALSTSPELKVWSEKLHSATLSSFKQDYRVTQRLGEGAYAKVFECQDRKTKEVFAVKVLEFDRGDQNSRIYMRRELSILVLLAEHPNIVSIRDVYEEPDRMYFIMSKSTCDLFDYMKQKGKFDEKRGKLVFRQVLSGIAHLHDAGVAHRDIKPKNLVLTSLTDVKITDFGSARALETAGIGMSMGLQKSVAGSGGFVAPEIISLKPYGRKCDLWSAGVLLYYMLSHQLPFDATTEVLTYAAIIRGQFKMEGPVWHDISNQAKDLIQSLIVLDQDKRPRAQEALRHPWFSTN